MEETDCNAFSHIAKKEETIFNPKFSSGIQRKYACFIFSVRRKEARGRNPQPSTKEETCRASNDLVS